MTPGSDAIAAIREAAMKATQGRWYWQANDRNFLAVDGNEDADVILGCQNDNYTDARPSAEDAAYIASVQPSVVLALLARLAAAEADAVRLRITADEYKRADMALDGFIQWLRECNDSHLSDPDAWDFYGLWHRIAKSVGVATEASGDAD